MPEALPIDFKDIDAAMADMQNEAATQQVVSSVSAAAGVNPDQHAETLKLSNSTGLPTDVVERNKPEVKKQAEMLTGNDILSLVNETPEAKAWLADHNNPKLISDDFSVLGRTKRTMKEIPGSFGGGMDQVRLNQLYYQEMTGSLTPAETAEQAALAKSLEGKDFTGGSWFRTATVGLANTAPQFIDQGVHALQGGVAGGAAGAAVGASIGATGGSAFGPFDLITIPAGAGAGGAAGFTLGFAPGAVSGMALENFKQQAGNIYGDMKTIRNEQGQGLDPLVMKTAATIAGAINGGLDILPAEKLAKLIPGADKILSKFVGKEAIHELIKLPGAQKVFYAIGKKWAEAGLMEGGTEGLQQISQISAEEIAKKASDGEFQPITFTEAARQTVEAARQGLVIGLAAGAAPAGASIPYEINRTKNITPEQVAAHVDQINQAVRESTLYQRSPDRFHSLVNDLAPDDKFYVNAGAAHDFISALAPEQQAALFVALPDLHNDLQTAMATNADVSIRKADYAALIAPHPEADALRDHIKVDPADMSIAERTAYSQFFQNNPELVQQMSQMEQAANLPNAPQETYAAVERMVRQTLQNAGRTSVESRAIAPLFARTLSRFAAPFGMNAVEQLNKNLLQFQQVNDQGQPITQASNVSTLLGDVEKLRSGTRLVNADDQTHAAVNNFSLALEKHGIPLDAAKQMDGRELLDRLYPPQDDTPDISSTLEQPLEIPTVETSNDNGQFQVALSANTQTISGIHLLAQQASQGNEVAHQALNRVAENSIERLTSGLQTVNIHSDSNTGLYGGVMEPSLGLTINFGNAERPQVLAALAKFASNYNQEQVHVREQAEGPVGTVYDDGSYNTQAVRFPLAEPLTREEIEGIIASSGLYGLTFNDQYLEAYHVGDPNDEAAYAEFSRGIDSVAQSLAGRASEAIEGTFRLWVYGEGSGAIPYERIAGDVSTETPGADATAKLIAERYFGNQVNPVNQAKNISEEQASIQRRIADQYEALPDDDMSNPLVQQAYNALATELVEQYRALPIKVDAWKGKGEPYENSEAMRRDVQDNNHLYYFQTKPDEFGPAGAEYGAHPLLKETEFVSDNGERMLANDLLRVVHDYYAHNLSPTQFGPRGEEAAWMNHMMITKSPWARWALTTETRAQNSWVNFNQEIYGKDVAIADRPFARQKSALVPLENTLTGNAAIDAPVHELMTELPPADQLGSLAQSQVGGLELAQKERGSITFSGGQDFASRLRKVVISFTDRANFSTGAHEFSHWAVATHRMFAEMARERIAAGDQTHEIRRIAEDWETLKTQVGATDDVFTVEQEEKVAGMFETYMREGNAPSESLRRIFTRFRDWLTKIYRDMTHLGVPLNDEVRGIFDRWLASEDEINQVKDKNSALAEIAQNLGLPANIADKIADYVNSATMVAEEKLYREQAQENSRRESKAYKDEFAALRPKVAEELGKKREYLLINYMKENGFKILGGPETDGIQSDIISEDESENVVHPDAVAELFGYDSGRQMISALKGTADFDRSVDYETRSRLREKYPDMIAQGRLHVAALPAIMNDRVMLALDLMIKELGRAVGDNSRVGMKLFAQQIAQARVADMKMSEVNYSFRYEVQREKELRDALIASRKGKANEAMLHLQRAMVNQVIYKSLEDFRDLRAKAEALFKKVDSKDKELAPRNDLDFTGAARFLLFKYGLGGENFDIQTWMNDIQERDPDVLQDLVSMSQMVAAPQVAAKDLTVAQFKQIYDAIKNIQWAARQMKEFEIGDRKMKVELAVNELTAQMGDVTSALRSSTQVVGFDRVRQGLSTVKAALRRVEHWVKAMDGGEHGPFRRIIWDTVSAAEDNYRSERTKWLQGYADILAKYKPMLSERLKIDTGMLKSDSLGRTAPLIFNDRMEMIGFLLHTGNQSNLDKLLGGYGIDPGQFQNSMARMERQGVITEMDWKLTQELWDYVEGILPVAQKAYRKLYGHRFDQIEWKPVVSKYGTFRGGYWPAIADPTQAANNKTVEQSVETTRQYMFATTGKDFTKGRVDNYKQPLTTDLRLGSQHIDKVLRFAHLEPAVRDVARIINRPEFKEKLTALDFDAHNGMLVPWLQRTAQQTTEPPPALGDRSASAGRRFLNFLRNASTSQIIRYNPVVAIQNLANISVAAHLVDSRELARAFVTTTMNPIETFTRVNEASIYMKERAGVAGQKASNLINQIADRKGPFKTARDFLLLHGGIFTHAVDAYLNPLVWTAAYNEKIKQDVPESEAIKHADSVIRQSMGSTGAKDVSKLEASHPLMKAIMPFYSYFNAQGNLTGTEFGNIIRKSGWAGSPKLFMAYLSLVAVPAVLGDFIAGGLRGQLPAEKDDDGEVLDDWFTWAFVSQLRYLGAEVPVVGQGINALVNSAQGKPMSDRLSISPVVSGGETLLRGGKNVAKLFNGDEVDDTRLIRDVMNSVGLIFNIPLGQASKPISFGVGVAEDKIHPISAADWGRGLVAGPPPKK